ADRRQRSGDRLWAAAHRPGRDRRGDPDGDRVRRLRGRWVLPGQAGRTRAGAGGTGGRDDRTDAADAGRDDADGPGELVGTAPAAPAARPDRPDRSDGTHLAERTGG